MLVTEREVVDMLAGTPETRCRELRASGSGAGVKL